MIINRPNVLKFFSNVQKRFENALATNMDMKWARVASLIQSGTKIEDYAWLGEVDNMRLWDGPKIVNRLKAYEYSLTNQDFEKTYAVKKNDIKDDKYGVYASYADRLAETVKRWRDDLVWDALQAGTTTNCYDGQFFFDTDHPVGKNTTTNVSNINTGGGGNGAWYLMDTRRSLKPLIFQERQAPTFDSIVSMEDMSVFLTGEWTFGVEARGAAGYGLWQTAYSDDRPLTAANFRADRLAMRNLENDEGRSLGIDPNVIVVGRANEDTARDLFGLPDTTTRGTNTTAVNPESRAVEIIVVPELP